MIAKLESFTQELDQLLKRHSVITSDPALQAVANLVSFDIEKNAVPSAELRARCAAHTKSIANIQG